MLGVLRAQGGAITRRQALGGCSAGEIRGHLRRGTWTAVRRGVYVAGRPEGRQRLVAEAAACWLALGRRAVLSHDAAAALHGLLSPEDGAVELTSAELHGRVVPGFRLHPAALPPGHVVHAGRLPVTSVARTAVDLARRLPFETAVALVDDALHRQLVDRDDLARVVRDCERWPHIRRAGRAVEAADGSAESPLETRCRLLFHGHGLPEPETQSVLVDPADGWYARVDFCWPRHRTVVEADGRLKYVVPADLWAEKLRQERIEELGWAVLRVTWHQVTREPERTVARVLRAFTRGAHLTAPALTSPSW